MENRYRDTAPHSGALLYHVLYATEKKIKGHLVMQRLIFSFKKLDLQFLRNYEIIK